MKRTIPLLLSFLTLSLFGQSGGNTVFGFLELPTSSHINALGGNNITLIEEDIASTFHNPALLGGETDKQASISYMNYMGGVNIGNAIYGQTIGERGTWAVAARYVDYGSFIQTSTGNEVLGTFSAKDICLQGTYSHDLSEYIRGGATFKFITSAYEQYTSVGLGVDLGLSYYHPDKELSLGVVFKNWGAQVKAYNETHERMPWDIQIGISKKVPFAPFSFSLTMQDLLRWNMTVPKSGSTEKDSFGKTLFKHFIIGMEIIPTKNLYISLAYNPKRADDFSLTDSKGMAGFSLGGGIKVSRIQVHASWAQHHIAGSSLMVGLNYNFAAPNL